MEEKFNALNLGISWSWTKFGNVSQATVLKFAKERNLTANQQGDLEDLWAKHPNRQQGKFNSSGKSTLLFHFLISTLMILLHK
jgi:hypothetical protein